jgi:hypothetical protein
VIGQGAYGRLVNNAFGLRGATTIAPRVEAGFSPPGIEAVKRRNLRLQSPTQKYINSCGQWSDLFSKQSFVLGASKQYREGDNVAAVEFLGVWMLIGCSALKGR